MPECAYRQAVHASYPPRGVRAGCLADTDGDGHPEVVLVDGWDKDYEHKARAQLRLAGWSGSTMEPHVLDKPAGDNESSHVLAADIDGDGRDGILAVTNARLRVVERDGDGWIAGDAAKGATDVAVLADGRIVTVGTTPELLTRPR